MVEQSRDTEQAIRDRERRAEQGRLESPYKIWQNGEGIPIYSGSYIPNLYELELAQWPRVGQRGAFVNLADQQSDDAWVIEIAPGEHTEPLHHLFEATYFVLQGRGATTFGYDPQQTQSVEWERGSIFAPPLNCWYRIFNGSGDEPVRLFAVTNAPMLLNIFRNMNFLLGVDYPFTDRYGGEANYFSDQGTKTRNRWKVNFVPNIRSFGLDTNVNRGAGGQLTSFEIANNSMGVHCSSFPTGTYKKAHRHNAGAHVIVVDGVGYSLLWMEGEEREKVDWQDGSVLSPRELEFHQHFNTGPTPARYLALRLGNLDIRAFEGFQGWSQIEYENEDPAIYDLYTDECEKNGGKVELPKPEYRASST